MAIYRGTGSTGTGGESDFAQLVQDAEAAAADAEAAQAAAETAETNAELAETNAETAATNAANSASAASTSASNAASSASAASTSASTATTQATNAANSATAAATSASNAATSATNAANSATAAQTAETNAETAETNAASSASAAASSASAASAAATNAATSASSASTSASNASNSATSASTSATSAANSASAALTSETNAASSATSAYNSASTATTAATNASNSATAASTSASNAATSETNAANSASAAATSATNASNSASAASTSASNASTSETNAAAYAISAAASYDSFDDRYLGSKSSAPSIDNDGNTLLVGALYFDTVTNSMKVWNGSNWLDAYASLSGALIATNNLSDLTSVSTARTNLGLGTAATTDSTDYATAAQGSNADTAYGWGDHASAGYAASGANTDITSLTGITGAIGTVDSIQFDTAAGVAVGQGQMAWNADERTFDMGLNGVTLQVGQEQVVNVRNNTGSTIANGTVCMTTGTLGASGRITVAPMDGTNSSNARYIIGIATEDITADSDGFVTTFGKIHNLDTSAWTDGAVLYTSTTTAGALTSTAPTSGLKQPIAFVIHAASNGTLFVRVNPLDENAKAADADKLDGNDSTYYQQALVSGTNIKTINGSSVLGSGDITVGVTALFPFYNSSGVLDTIGLLSGQYLPFFDNTGSAKNIQLTT